MLGVAVGERQALVGALLVGELVEVGHAEVPELVPLEAEEHREALSSLLGELPAVVLPLRAVAVDEAEVHELLFRERVLHRVLALVREHELPELAAVPLARPLPLVGLPGEDDGALLTSPRIKAHAPHLEGLGVFVVIGEGEVLEALPYLLHKGVLERGGLRIEAVPRFLIEVYALAVGEGVLEGVAAQVLVDAEVVDAEGLPAVRDLVAAVSLLKPAAADR